MLDKLRRLTGRPLTSREKLLLVGLCVLQGAQAVGFKVDGQTGLALLFLVSATVCPLALLWDWTIHRERLIQR